jgi:hypothetical protein
MKGMKDRAVRMIENYAARLNTGQCGAERNIGLKEPARRYAAAMERQDRIVAGTKPLLRSLDIPPYLVLVYYRFALRLGKIVHNAWGEHARLEEARILVSTWQARGLERDIMLKIAREVFELEITEEKLEARNPNDD